MTRQAMYSTVLEAIGMLGARSAIHNKLNKVHAFTDDAALRSLLKALMDQLSASSSHTSHTQVERLSACKRTAAALRQHCEAKLEALRSAAP